MKLRNKKTGEIIEVLAKVSFVKKSDNFMDNEVNAFDSLAELNEEWEDYEEPKKFWFIDDEGGVQCGVVEFEENINLMKAIGNYFETKEEAKKAVERLRAWKRLKDKGFVWQGWEEGAMDNGMCVIGCQIPENNWETDVVEDLDLLFGGEE